MAKLSDLQLVLLSTAAARSDGSLLPPAANVTQAGRNRRTIATLVGRELAADVPVSRTSRTAVRAALTHQQTRCAIYTRKSTEEGLEQAFNSLDAQREACAAYIASQRHEGWTASPERYDDGGTMERPGAEAAPS